MEYNNSLDDKSKEKKLEINFCIDENKINKNIDFIDINFIKDKKKEKNIDINIIKDKTIIKNFNKNIKEVEKLFDDTSESEDEMPKKTKISTKGIKYNTCESEDEMPKKTKLSTKNISTEGIKYNTQEYHQHKNNIKICDCCHLHFNLNMLADTEFGSMCQHCYFFLNFTNPESKYGWTLESYVELCKKDHDMQKCEKFKNSGTCHLCFASLDTQSIQNTQKKKEEKKPVKYTEPEKIHIDSDDEICIYEIRFI